MTNIKKALIGTAAATAMAVSATPAVANHGKHNDKISAGEVIAGAVVLGGIAAILTSGKRKHRDRDYHRGHRGERGYGYNNGYKHNYRHRSSRKAVKRCIRRAENWASQYGDAKVTNIRDIDRTRYGYKIKGRIIVRDSYRGGKYNKYNRRGYGYNNYDKGKFTCYVERGRVVDVKYRGLR